MSDEEIMWQALHQVIDPEVGINIVDLGLVYKATLQAGVVEILMTMTSPACPLGGLIEEDVRLNVGRALPQVQRVEVELTFDPPWSPEKLSAAARQQLGWEPGR